MAEVNTGKITGKQLAMTRWIVYAVFLCWSFWNDFRFFDFTYEERVSYYTANGNPNNVIFYILVKMIFVILSYMFFRYVSDCVAGWLAGDQIVMERVRITVRIFVVYILVLVLVNPGIWVRAGKDEFQIISFIQRLQIQYHQGVVSSIMFMLAFMCYPKPVMVIVIQMLIGAMILGDAAADIKRRSRKAYLGFMILVFSPASLYFALYPLRIYLFSVLMIAFLHDMFKIPDDKRNRVRDLTAMTFLVCVLTNTRIEIKFLIVLFPVLLLKYYRRKAILCAELVVICSVFAGSMLNTLGNQACSRAHNMLMMCGPLSLFLADDTIDRTRYEEDIANIDKVFDVERLRSNSKYNYCSGERVDGYSEEEYKKCLLSMADIFVHHPEIYVRSKLLCALDGLGLSKNMSGIRYSFPAEIKPNDVEKYFRDVNVKRHDQFAGMIAGDFSINGIPMYYVFYAFWIPCIAVILTMLLNIRSDRVLCRACGIVTLQLVLTIATEPTSYQIYFFVEYLAGWYLVLHAWADKEKCKDGGGIIHG